MAVLLLVEVDRDALALFADVFRAEGFDVIAVDGAAAAARALAGLPPPTVAFIGIGLSDWTLVSLAREMAERGVDLIVFSGWPQSQLEERHGPMPGRFLAKGASPEEVVAVIARGR